MGNTVYRVDLPDEYRRAGPSDLIRLLPVAGNAALYVAKGSLEALVYGITRGLCTHLSGPTGSGKSSLLLALTEPRSFRAICQGIGQPDKPMQLYPIEMATFETPGELYQRRSLRDGTTFDEESRLVTALIDAEKRTAAMYPVVWLREMGRVHSSSVQGGLLDLITPAEISLPDDRTIDGRGIAWVADSNYQAESDATHTLVTLDDALRRRFQVNLTLGYLEAHQEVTVIEHLWAGSAATNGNDGGATNSNDGGAANGLDRELVMRVVKLGQIVREHRSQGRLQSVAPPSIDGYLTFLRMAAALPQLGPEQVAMSTVLGNAGPDDLRVISGLLNEVFGLQQHTDEKDPTLGGKLF